MVLVGLHGTEGSGTGGELVRELALMVLLTVEHLLVSLLRFVCWKSARCFTWNISNERILASYAGRDRTLVHACGAQ